MLLGKETARQLKRRKKKMKKTKAEANVNLKYSSIFQNKLKAITPFLAYAGLLIVVGFVFYLTGLGLEMIFGKEKAPMAGFVLLLFAAIECDMIIP
jgi:hypothetical protein